MSVIVGMLHPMHDDNCSDSNTRKVCKYAAKGTQRQNNDMTLFVVNLSLQVC